MKVLQTDVVIVGAGPVGLFQVFELGLQGLSAVVIDSLAAVGGQCMELYPAKPIYDIPAMPKVLAGELIENLITQAAPFKPQYLLSQQVQQISKRQSNDFLVTTDKQLQVQCKAVIVAAGNGAFAPVKLAVAGIEQFEPAQVRYRVGALEQYSNQHVVVLGGGDSAFDWALALEQVAASVVLIHRSVNFRAAPDKVQTMYQLCDQLKMQFLCGQVIDFKQREQQLSALVVRSKDGVNRIVALDKLLVCFGLSPKLGPIANWGLDMHQHQIRVDTEQFATSVKGIYAVGDVNYYPGKRKLILSGFHEAALAAFAIAKSLSNGQRIATLYTTTSPVVQRRMGLATTVNDLVDNL